MNIQQLEQEYAQKFEEWLAEQAQRPDTMPTESEMVGYRARFQKLGDELMVAGLTKSPKLLPERKLLNFLLSETGAPRPKEITRKQWDDFCAGVEVSKTTEGEGLWAIVQSVNVANGLSYDGKRIKV